ncbi:hypothetical protein B1A_05884 [mine drainage metagenome]|uniref:DUF4440 domain-containing protein n=1 Tax=mine drainage metagenome TaxID=410659 RepID=T1CRX9_9ZZZZ
MNAHAAIEATLHAAEAALLDAQQRADVNAIAALLASDFEEIGSSGRRYDRDSMLAALGTAKLDAAEITNFSLRLLAADLALVNFRTRLQRGDIVLHSVRSSVWRREHDAWRIAFHQGTPCAG